MIRIWTLMSLLMLLITTNSFAQDAIALNKGDIVPFSGNLIKTEKLQEFFKSHQKLPLVEAKLELEAQRNSLYKDRLRDTEKQLSRANLKGNLGTIGGFILGVVITSVAAKAALESTR